MVIEMSRGYAIYSLSGITIIRLTKEPGMKMLKAIIDELAERELYRARLWDLSKIKFNLSYTDLQAIADYGKKKFLKPNLLAMVVGSDFAFGEIRQFMAHREEGVAAANVFHAEEEALRWLHSKRKEIEV